MKTVLASLSFPVPSDVTVHVRSRVVSVQGTRGRLTRSFRHIAVNIVLKDGVVTVDKWLANRKQNAIVRTICSHIKNMIKGVTVGFQYKMRAVYAHFPINISVSDDHRTMEIRNFLGEKYVRKVKMAYGVTCFISTKLKDEVILEGINVELVSLSAAKVHQSTLVKGKDIRKFLDGIYVSEKGVIGPA